MFSCLGPDIQRNNKYRWLWVMGGGGCTVDPSSPQTITLQVAGLLCTKNPTSPTFILRAQESLPKLPINVSTKSKENTQKCSHHSHKPHINPT